MKGKIRMKLLEMIIIMRTVLENPKNLVGEMTDQVLDLKVVRNVGDLDLLLQRAITTAVLSTKNPVENLVRGTQAGGEAADMMSMSI